MTLKPTRTERRILANQYLIMELLDPKNAEEYRELRTIVEHGYEGEYDGVFQMIYDEPDTMTREECTYVGDVLQMYDMMQTAYKNGQTDGTNSARLKFPGFDGNHETKFMAYARFMREHDKWTFIDLASADFNSHFPTASKYAQMLNRWMDSENKYELTAADIARILG